MPQYNLNELFPSVVGEALRLLAISPLEQPDLALCRSWTKCGAAAALDIGRDSQAWPGLFQQLARDKSGLLGIRVPDGVELDSDQVPENIAFVLLTAERDLSRWSGFPCIVQVTSLLEGQQSLANGASGLIAKGRESGGLVGDESAYILLQRLLADEHLAGLPIWSQGGIGLHTAAAVIAGGGFGVVLDSQLGLLTASKISVEQKNLLGKLEGTESRVLHGRAVYARPGPDVEALDALTAEQFLARLESGDIIPLGQDAALASELATLCPNSESLVNQLRVSIAGHLRQAKALCSLSSGAPLAKQHGTRYPIVQGPMTRVSDTAEFAKAVADNGALPFLALSLMAGKQCEVLMKSTRELLEEQSWGVGILGFAPAEVLQPQLDLINTFKPSVVLIAGGRPSQARAMEEQGIQAYLHVPAPGLLDLFLKDGARSFIFEGQECGGHVGPRFSFVLWEQQINRLLNFEKPQELNILFAGGIHDERSAAMVAAASASLAARGAKIGVLMGSAYIATKEAVETQAINALFQQQVIDSESTALLETAPGHATRGLNTPFVEYFAKQKEEMAAQGLDRKEIWAKLEELNVGRLRLATKGIERVGGKLVERDEQTQRDAGMYMIGQLAAMRQQVCSMAELHDSVSDAANSLLQAAPIPAFFSEQKSQPIAIIGMECIYPGSPDLESYWSNIIEGRDLTSEVPAERWNSDIHYGTNARDKGQTPSKWGGFIDDVAFNPLDYGIPPQSLAAIEPVQLLSLEVSKRALIDAGYAADLSDLERDKTSVIFGAESGTDLASAYSFRNHYQQYLGSIPAELDAVLPSLTEDSFPGVLVNVIAGRVANRLDLGGVNYTVDSACASSLTAMELAVKELRAGTSDVVLAGGADFHNGINDFLMFASVTALAASGKCRSFDNQADGIALGEGVGVVVLKRLEDAERDGDRIYALIDGVAGSSDGKSLGLTAPRKEGQKRALDRAYWQAGVLPGEVGLVEAHGTGTVVGDKTELATLTEIFTQGGALNQQAVLGSVKSQIGHTKCAAGIAGLIKISKALYHKILPPTQNIKSPNAYYQSANSPFTLDKQARPWLDQSPRAAISAFGFGGTNFHAVLSAYEPDHTADSEPSTGLAQWPAELFVFRGKNMEHARSLMAQCLTYVSSNVDHALRDLSYSLYQIGKEAGTKPVQCSLVATDTQQLKTLLQKAQAGQTDAAIFYRDKDAGSEEAGKLAFLFPGQGSQSPGMLRDIFLAFPQLRDILQAGAEWLPQLYPPTSYEQAGRRAQQQAITDTRVAQPTLGMVDFAMARVLAELGVCADMMAGHSYGELVALSVAGSFGIDDLLSLSAARGQSILAAAGDDPGRMAAVSANSETISRVLETVEDVVLANQNSPKQTVISGPSSAIEQALVVLKEAGIAASPIEVACAFHSPVVAAAEQTFADQLALVDIKSPATEVYSNRTAAVYPQSSEEIKQQLAAHIVNPVRFVEQIEAMYADGARTFVEVGPGRVLNGLVKNILVDKPHQVIATDAKGEAGLPCLLQAVAQLLSLGQSLNLDYLYQGRGSRRLDLSTPVELAKTTWWVNGARSKPLVGKLPAHAAIEITTPVQVASRVVASPMAAVSTTTEGNAVAQYLNNMRDMVHSQRDVMLGMFGQPPAASAIVPSAAAITAQPQVSAPIATTSPSPATSATVSQVPTGQDIKQSLIAIVSDRTGYPADMLDLDLDLEADLSIDSIKRVEIIAQLADELGFRQLLGGDADGLMEQLAAQKSLREILSWLDQQLPNEVTAPVAVAVAATASPSQDVQALLLHIVSERTGYPQDVLELDLDLEADLSIDSIKRLEIVGELAEKLGLQDVMADKDAALESLAALKTLRAMIQWLNEQVGPQAAVEQAAQPAATVDAKALLLNIVSERTGYPEDVLDLELDLEADLSIDSIKRLEIVAQLATKLGLEETLADKDAALESLAALKTLRAMLDWLNAQTGHSPEIATATEAAVVSVAAGDTAPSLTRYVVKAVATGNAIKGDTEFSGKHFVITDDSLGIAPRLKYLLELHGASVDVISFDENKFVATDLGAVDGLIHLWGLNPESRVRDIKRLFSLVRDGLMSDISYLLVAGGLGGSFGHFRESEQLTPDAFGQGGGTAGMVKSIVKEWPDVRAHWVDLDLSDSTEELAAYLELELLAENPLTEVGYQDGTRQIAEVVETALSKGDGINHLDLNSDSVLLITGGAQGITAKLAIAMATRFGCKLELVGRSPLPDEPEAPDLAAATDLISLRKLIIGQKQGLTPGEVEQRCSRILSARAIRQTLVEIETAGGLVNYHSLDVRDITAFEALIVSLYQKYGKIDGVIHGAGVVEDKLLRHKTEESFERVFDTKVRAALVLSNVIRDDVKFVVFFSSVAGAFGNRGQIDYASANDTLDKIAHSLQSRVNGRVLSVNWGPWAGKGMVSAELEREYARKGIGLIPLSEGVDALLNELKHGDREDAQVVLMCASVESMGKAS